MATAHQTSGKSRASRKRARPARKRTSELTRLLQKVDELVTVVQAQRSCRSPLPEYAKVVALGLADEAADVRGRTGIVLDVQNSQGAWTYTVYFPAKQETLVLHGESLWDTGETVPEDVIYGGGQTQRVRVDDEGNGMLVV